MNYFTTLLLSIVLLKNIYGMNFFEDTSFLDENIEAFLGSGKNTTNDEVFVKQESHMESSHDTSSENILIVCLENLEESPKKSYYHVVTLDIERAYELYGEYSWQHYFRPQNLVHDKSLDPQHRFETFTPEVVKEESLHDNQESFPIPDNFCICLWDGCRKAFMTLSLMHDHINTHHSLDKKESKFPCLWGHCEKKYIHKKSLIIHLRNHTRERPYVCDLCGYSFIARNHLNRHLKRHKPTD
jgi:hypothetical protein